MQEKWVVVRVNQKTKAEIEIKTSANYKHS